MPSVKGIGYTNHAVRPMEKTTSMNKQVSDHGNKAHYMKVGKYTFNFFLIFLNMRERDNKGRFIKKGSEKAEKKSKKEEGEGTIKEDLFKRKINT